MALTLNLAILRSRKIATQNKAKRAVGGISKTGILQKITRFGGWIFGQITRFFNLDFDRLWDILVEGYFALKFFDWNATDEALQKQIESNNKRIVTAAAEALGTTLGWGTVRLANFFLGRFLGKKESQTAAKIKVPVLSARIGLALAEEGNEEVQMQVRRFLSVTATAQISNAFINFVLTSRRNEWFGMSSITKPQSNGSIAQKIEEKIEKLPEFWRQPVEQLIEGFEDAIIEAGYVIAYTIDDHVAAMKYANQQGQTERVIEIKPNKDSEEKLEFKGAQSQIIQSVSTTLYGTHPLIENRDIGEYLGYPADEQIKLEPQLRVLKIAFSEYEKPPFSRKGKYGKRTTISIPDAKPGLTWRELKTACPKYTSGDCWVTVKLRNGRQMHGWFNSSSEGKQILTQLARLSTEPLLPETFRSSTGEVTPVSRRTKRLHPIRVALLYPKRKNGERFGVTGTNQKMDLWTDTEPKGTAAFK